MSMGEIKEILKNYSSRNLFTITLRMLTDHDNNSVNLPESEEIIKKTKSICDTIKKTKSNTISGKQAYSLLEFVANSIIVYGNTTDEIAVKNLYRSLL
ncbi:hypothetical protein [Clostridium estertheticum]|uniref:Uncharacterized protein n=1 Tax=Clostridium estertheticum TaxID=238834 RepID=A0A7Y3SZY7_9CLOT|nr:hypothetical protein [Clostridium estertheticum]NNU78123.1 hypothetical protein [Clostridium estertheticum]WBL47765.1 hypothetical protein LOR37_03480 [Clostridium estertheticum]